MVVSAPRQQVLAVPAGPVRSVADVIEVDALAYLRSKGETVFAAAGREATMHCPWCPPGHGGAKGKGKCYVNRETFQFMCQVCARSGGRKVLMEHYGDEVAPYSVGEDPGLRSRILSEFTEAASDQLLGNTAMLDYLLARGLAPATIIAAKLGYVPAGRSITKTLGEHRFGDLKATGLITEGGTEYHAGRITIPYLSSGRAVSVRGKDPSGKYFTAAGDAVRLYRSDALREAEDVIVTEGEFDALILAQTLADSPNVMHHRFAVVAVPGTASLPGGAEGFADYFRSAKRVYLAFDADAAGRAGATRAKELIGTKARVVELPKVVDAAGEEVALDWTDYLRPLSGEHPHGGHGVADVMDLINTAEMTGKRLFSVSEAHTAWTTDRTLAPGIKLGFPSLDAVISPGLRPGNIAIPMAKTGVGKTVLLANIDYNLRAHRVLHITLENTVTEFYELLQRIHRFWQPLALAGSASTALPHLRITDENRLTGDDLTMLIEEYRADVGERPEVVMLDYLGYFARSFKGGSSYEKTSNAVMELKAIAKANNVAIICPSQVGRAAGEGTSFTADKARDSGVVEETGDFVLSYYRPHEAADNVTAIAPGAARPEVEMQILKSRRGGKGKIVKLAMSPASLAVADRADGRAYARICQEVEAYNRGMTYAEIASATASAEAQRAQLRAL